MKLAFVILKIAGGGLERRTVNIVNVLSMNQENDVYLITAMEESNEYRLNDIVTREQILKGSLGHDVKILKRFVKENNIDILVGMGLYANWLVCMERLLGACKVVGVEANDPRRDQISFKSRVLRKLLYWRADGFVFQTEEEKSFYSTQIQKKSIVIHNPVKSDLPVRESDVKKELVAVGRLYPQKNYKLLINAFQIVLQKHPEYKLRIFGQGPEAAKLHALTKKLKISQAVTFEGFSTDVHNQINKSDIYVLSSDFEGMPNALLESMAMGFPVISTDCGGGGPRELIIDGENGILTPVNNVTVLAEKICWMIENSNEKEKMAESAYKIRKTHSIDKICKEWEIYIERIGRNNINEL